MKKFTFKQETKHLLYWWSVWLKRLLLTSYHLINRRAYRNWKEKRAFIRKAERELFMFEPLDCDLFDHNDIF